MSYFELLEQFWQLDTERTIAPLASKLYFYLLNQFNSATPRWPAKINRRANQIYADLNVDKKSLATAVAVLEERGLIAYVGGSKTAASVWWLNYQPIEGKNSPQQQPDWSKMKGKNSPSSATKTADWSEMEGKNSPPIRKRTELEENKTKGGCEAAEEITLAPLPAEKEVSAPRCEAPPQNRGSVELPEAVATEAKQLATTIGQLWKISEITNYTKWARIAAFTKRLAQLGQLAQVTQQFAGYKLQRERAGLRPHSLDTWLGTYADDFANGEWCGCDWAAVAADTRTRPGESLSTAAPARAATSPTKARANNWS